MTTIKFNWTNADQVTDQEQTTIKAKTYKALAKLDVYDYHITYMVKHDYYKVYMRIPFGDWQERFDLEWQYIPEEKGLYLEYESFDKLRARIPEWIDNPIRHVLEYQANLSNTTKLTFQGALDLMRMIEKVMRDMQYYTYSQG
jgi:hypothetical protein